MTQGRVNVKLKCQAGGTFYDPIKGRWYYSFMPIHALSTAEVAERTGVRMEAVRSMLRRGKFPEPDVVIGGTNARPVRGWMVETVDAWLASRQS